MIQPHDVIDAETDFRKILLITLSNIGDLVMTTPVMESLHAQYPQALIDIVADRRSSELLEYCPYLGDLILRDKEKGWPGTWKLVRRLREQRYGLVVDLRTDGLAWLLRARQRLTRQSRRLSTGHAVERHMAVLRGNGTPASMPRSRVWLSQEQQAYAAEVIDRLPGQRWLAIGPGANWEPKRWPAHHFRELVRRLAPAFDAVVCLGNQDDSIWCHEIIDRQSIDCLNLAGRTGLLQAAAVLQHMRLFIGNDSGLGHIAAAAGIPTLTVFGPGEPDRYHPWGPDSHWLESPDKCMENLAPSEVEKLARELLSETATLDMNR